MDWRSEKQYVRFIKWIRKPNFLKRLAISAAVVLIGVVFIRNVLAALYLPPKLDGANEYQTMTDSDIASGRPDETKEYGYASASSVPQGESINFYVSTDPAIVTYDLEISRQGASGLDLMMTISDLPGAYYECGPVGVPPGQEDVVLGCNWPIAYTLDVPADWPSGVYVANILDADDKPGDYGAYIYFIVTEAHPGSTSDILFQFPTNTWQAYNKHEGWGFYTEPRAVKLTFDRPYRRCNPVDGCRFKREVPLVRWLESEGYTVEYVASEDVHVDPTLLFNYRLFLSVGHDEYWTKEIRDNIDAFIDAGGNVAFFAANTSYRQVRYEDGLRTLVGYKADWQLDPLYGVDNTRLSTKFGRQPWPGWPQNSTTGLGWTGWINKTPGDERAGRYTVYRSDHWVYEGTGLQDGDEFWYEPEKEAEVDGTAFVWENGVPVVTGEEGTPLNFIILGLQPSTAAYATMGVYTRLNGGTVFNAASYWWSRGLWPEYNPDDYPYVRQITKNVIDTLSSGQPPPPTFPVQETSFTYQPPNPFEGDSITFSGVITPAYASQPVTYTWQIDDGLLVSTTATTNVISHTYKLAGTYVISLTAANAYGQSSYTRTVIVHSLAPPPAPDDSSHIFLPLVFKGF